MSEHSSAVRDITNALEKGRFKFETPRVIVDMDRITDLSIGQSREITEDYFGNRNEGPLTLDLKFCYSHEWDDDPHLYRDLENHVNRGYSRFALHGDAVIWYVETAWDYGIECGVEMKDEKLNGDIDISWRDVEIAGPR